MHVQMPYILVRFTPTLFDIYFIKSQISDVPQNIFMKVTVSTSEEDYKMNRKRTRDEKSEEKEDMVILIEI
jgi:hypothetical protein